MIRRYRVMTRSLNPSSLDTTIEVDAFDAADALVQTKLKFEGCYPGRRAVCIEPIETVEPVASAALSPSTEQAVPIFFWRGDAQEFAEQVSKMLDVERLAEVAGEMAVVWRNAVRERSKGET